ncbi:MAG: hypothetical protein ACI4D9_09435 [Lachnospiraceae bacterium]
MAKSKSFFGLRKGSTKTLTFSVLDGQQITKDRVTDVKNPRSKAQMEQRCILKTTALGYATLKSIVDHSFEGVSYGAMSQRNFMAVNAPLVRRYAADNLSKFGYAAYRDSSPNMGQFVIAQGSLSPIPSNAISLSFAEGSLNVNYNGGVVSTSAIANALGVNLGDIVTVCALAQNAAAEVIFVWLRMILPSEDVEANAENIKFESNKRFSVAFDGNVSASIIFDEVDNITNSAAALYTTIRSQKSDMGFKRSNATLNQTIGTPVYASKWTAALLSYPQGESYILNGGEQGIAPSAPTEKYAVTINNSTVAVISGTGFYAAGVNVTLVATNVPSGKLVQFSNVPGHSEAVTSNSVTFVMRQEPVEITVTLIDKPADEYEVKAASGYESDVSGLGMYAVGEEVTVAYTGSANLDSTEPFSARLEGGSSVSVTKISAKSVKFSMPEGSVIVTPQESYE